MSSKEAFEKAAQDVTQLKSRPDNDTLLKLYGLFKQGSSGDVSGSRPGMLDVKGRKKYDSWASLKGKSPEEAQLEYIQLVDRLKSQDS